MNLKKIIGLGVSLIILVGCKGQDSEFIKAAGIVDGEVLTIKAAVPGEIKTLNIKEGKTVNKGDLLVKIDDQKLKNKLETLDISQKEILVEREKLYQKVKLLKSNLSYWKDQVQSLERLYKKESVSGDKLKKTQLKVKELETSLQEAKQTLSSLSLREDKIKNQKQQIKIQQEDYVICSPVKGIILEKFVSQGERVFPAQAVAEILDEKSLFVETFVEERELSLLKLGQKVSILVDGQKGREYPGTIIYFGQQAEFSPKYVISEKERKSLLYQVKIKIEQDLEDFKLGMPVTVKLKKQP